jgi:benzoyl-CoA reductase/2-hydroxyglutaryl-CoA dehydratase subunit BcrC/BadD/HgdB
METNPEATGLPETPRLLITGGMFDNYQLFEKIPEFNHVIADDLSFGTRNINFFIPKGSFVEEIAQTYLARIPDPTALDMEKRLINLKNQIHGHEVDGVILLGLKWCDPDAFEFVPIQNMLKDQDIPYLKLETTPDLSNLEQIQTRLSAFIEMTS